jgi:mycofactocin system glycosyltransferase
VRPALQQLPAGFAVELDPSVRRPRPTVLVGGNPVRVLRLTAAGAKTIERWAAGEVVGTQPAQQALARRLLDSGIAHPRAKSCVHPSPEDVTVVIPVRDEPTALAQTIAALDGAGPAIGPVIVVDDGSEPPLRSFVSTQLATRLLRRSQAGPAAARNDGWRGAQSELVAFVDAGCVPSPGWLEPLLAHFADPAVGAVAPRVMHRPSAGCPRQLDEYERVRSRLDLGPAEGPVQPASTLSYVPSAALLVRRSALEAVGGFDENLRFGEDVDLVWRLDREGWLVRYEPVSTVTHPGRSSPSAWVCQRVQYGSSAAPLSARHGCKVAPLAASWWSVAVWALALCGRPAAALGVAAATSAKLALRALPDGPTAVELARRAGRGHLLAGLGLARAIRQAWLPPAAALLIPCSTRTRASAALATALVAVPLAEWVIERPEGLGPLEWVALRLADDLAYQAGVWRGVLRARSARAIMPRVAGRRRVT